MDTWLALHQLATASGPPGYESGVADIVSHLWREYIDDIRTDPLGNVIAHKAPTLNSSQPAPAVMLATHMDEVSLMVSGILAHGFLRALPIGGVDLRQIVGQEVLIHGKSPVSGVVSALPSQYRPADQAEKAPEWEQIFIDTGLDDQELHTRVAVGDCVTFAPPCVRLQGERTAGKAFDNRTSVVAVLECLKRLSHLNHAVHVYAVATVQEEVGLRGAMVSTYGIMPQAGIAIDVGFGASPGLPEKDTLEMGKGPGITIGANIHRGIRSRLLATAKVENISTQIETAPGSSGTDAWAMQIAQAGVPTAVLSLPLRYMHSPVESIDLADIVSTGRLLATFIASLEPNEVWGWANGTV